MAALAETNRSHSAPEAAEVRGHTAHLPFGLRVLPSLSDLFFIAVFTWMFIAGQGGFQRLLADGDIGWHIRTGEYILDSGSVPKTDLFTFTKPDQPWFAWEWLSDIAAAAAHRALGLKGVVLLAAIVIATWPLLLLRHALWRGANVWSALGVTLLGIGAGSIHFLARPHVFTLVFTAVAVWMVEADRRVRSWRVWLLVPLTALWTNLHGGFPILPGLLLLASIGVLAEDWFGARTWRNAVRYAGLAMACAIASIVNPYGFRLHAHMGAYLRSDWIRTVVDEFKAPDFRSEQLAQFELLLITALMFTTILFARRRFVHALWFLAVAHLSLTTVRHVPIFVAVAAPILAELLTDSWAGLVRRMDSRSTLRILDRIATDLAPGFRRTTLWPAIFLVAVASSGEWMKWPKDFPGSRFPVDLIRSHEALLAEGRVLTLDQWGDYLIYKNYPRQRVFADGRSDFLGPQLGNDYIKVSNGHHRWSEILNQYSVDVVLAPVNWPLATILKSSPDWTLVADTGSALLYRRTIAPLNAAIR